MNTNPVAIFQKRLASLRRRRQAALLAIDILALSGEALMLLAIYALADFFLAFPPAALVIIDASIVVLLLLHFILRASRTASYSDGKMSEDLDKAFEHRRQDILSAYELRKEIRSRDGDTDIREYLVARVMKKASHIIEEAGFRQIMPFREFRNVAKMFLVQVLVCAAILGIPRHASAIILARIFHPFDDNPPYSSYTFEIDPAEPEVIYGGNIEISATVRGAKTLSQVWLMTRDETGMIHKAPCFREGGNKFVQRIEKVTAPLSFCFSTGRARSRWTNLELLLQPQISMAQISLAPPAYSRLPAKTFYAGAAELQGLPGTIAELSISSNRPLSHGRLSLKYKKTGATEIIAAEKSGDKSLLFRWEIKEEAQLKAYVSDFIGTECREPLLMAQTLKEDAPPRIHLLSPETFLLATPSVKVPVSARAEDDIGIKRIDFVRSVTGFRDRAVFAGPREHTRSYSYETSLDLKVLGVVPGETIELYFEASDFNPSMLGYAVSDVAKISIISEEDYARQLRDRTACEQFFERYRVMEAELLELKKLLSEMKQSLQKGELDLEGKGSMIKKIKEANDRARNLFGGLEKDFPIYDIEKEHGGILEEFTKLFDKNELAISQMKPSDSNPDLETKIDELLNQTESSQGSMDEMTKDAGELEKLVKVLRHSVKFMALLGQQEYLARRLQRYASENTPVAGSPMLKTLGIKEMEIRKELMLLSSQLAEDAKAITDAQYDDLKKSSLKFSRRIDELEIPELMRKSAETAESGNGERAHHHGKLALEKMRQIASEFEESEFGSCCLGNEGRFNPSFSLRTRDRIQKTLGELLQSLICQQKGGRGAGSGLGIGGGGLGNLNDGYSAGDYSPLKIPIIGPDRLELSQSENTGASNDDGAVAAGKSGIGAENRELLKIDDRTKTGTESIPLDEVPEKYIDAVKNYFGQN